jgi:hypothetical protein
MRFNQVPPAFTLDFVPRRARPSLPGWLLLAAGLLAAFAALIEYQAIVERRDELASQVARLQRAQNKPVSTDRQRRSERSNERAAATERLAVARVAATLATPWASLLPLLESASNADVALLTLDADNSKAQIAIEGDARTLEAVFAYADRLGAQAGFANVQVQNYQFQKRGGIEVVHFRLTTRWSKLS